MFSHAALLCVIIEGGGHSALIADCEAIVILGFTPPSITESLSVKFQSRSRGESESTDVN